MADVLIYTSPICPYCVRAKKLLDAKGVTYQQIDIQAEPGRREEMVRLTGGRTTVPQIFIDGQPVGGCDDLYALDRAGKLNPLLGLA